MFSTLSTSWAAALAIAVPIAVLFWWARRNAPANTDRVDYAIGRHAQPAADTAGHAAAPAPQPAPDAPVPANPAALAPPTEPAASTDEVPAHAPLPTEPVSVAAAVPAPAVTPAPPPEPPAPVPQATVTPQPAAARAAVEPAAVAAKAPEPVVEPSAPAAPTSAVPETVAAAVQPEPAAASSSAAAPAMAATAEPPSGPDDFTRLYGLDAAAIAALQGAGIHTYRDLAAANVVNLRQILADAGQPAIDPATWPQQARFAAGGKWKILDARFQPKA